MEKAFEDFFSELQADMVSICLEYVEKKADNIYIYCCREGKISACGYFFRINGQLRERHKLNDNSDILYDVSIKRQKAVMDVLNENLSKIEALCSEFHRPMPTEIKLCYDIQNNSLSGEYKYEPVFLNHLEKTPADIENEWFEELRRLISEN